MDDLFFSNEYFYDEVREGFYVPEMMKRYWAAQLEVLKEIDKICQKHQLIWFANYGTMLGAVRHQGYIPWDDDLDITMFRDDYDKFFELAKSELPEGYCILTSSEQEEWVYPFGRITNGHAIDLTTNHLNKFHGCPYAVGIDIFPYDKVFPNSKEEEERDNRGYDIYQALSALESKNSEKLENLLKTIESRNNSNIIRNANISHQLIRILEKICIEANDYTSNEVALLYSWFFYRKVKFPRYYFENYVEMPFENTVIPIPKEYKKMLNQLYSNYTIPSREGGDHNYPAYAEQEQIYKIAKGTNPFRYTLTIDAVPPKRFYPTVCKHREILFLPCRLEWWNTLEPVFKAAVSNPHNTVNVIPIPHFDCDNLGNIGDVHINANDFKKVNDINGFLTTFEEYGFGKRRPDVIVIQVPFDEYSGCMTVPEVLYSANLLQYTDELAYVPCFDTLIPESDNDKIIATLKTLIEQPAVVNADRIILKHERIKEIYVKTLTALTSANFESYWNSKICLLSDVDWCKK